MSKSVTWLALVVLSGLLVASWWAINRNVTQGQQQAQAQANGTDPASKKASFDLDKAEAKDAKWEAKAKAALAQAKKAHESKATFKKKAPYYDGPHITANWFREQAPGKAGIKAEASQWPYEGK